MELFTISYERCISQLVDLTFVGVYRFALLLPIYILLLLSYSSFLFARGFKQQILTRAVSRHFGMRLAVYNEL